MTVIAPASAPQVPALKLAGVEHPFAQQVMEEMRRRGAAPVTLWRVINGLANARNLDSRARRRFWRLRCWRAVRELLKAELLFRHGPLISVVPFATKPKPRRQDRHASRPVTAQPLSPSAGESIREMGGSNPVLPRAESVSKVAQMAERQVVIERQQPLPCINDTKSAPAPAPVPNAASQLARLPRNQPRKFTGFLHGERCWRGRLVILPGGEIAPLMWISRGKALLQNTCNLPFRTWAIWGTWREEELRLFKHPAAAALGRLKRGVRERKSELKAKAARINGLLGGRPRKRNGD